MKRNTVLYLAPFVAFVVFLLDSQFSTLLTNLTPGTVSIASYLFFIIGILYSFYLPLSYSMVLFALFGILYDWYYLNLLGIATTLFPLVIYLVYYFYQNLKFKIITNWMILLVIIFIFEFGGFLLARLFQVTNLSMFIFVFYNLVPTMIFNSLLLLILYPLLRGMIGITNKI